MKTLLFQLYTILGAELTPLFPGDDAVADDYASIAMYFENQKQHFLAGKFFLKSAQYAKVRGA